MVLLAEAAALLLVSVSAYYFCLSHSLRMTVLLAMIAAGFTAIQLPWCIRFLFGANAVLSHKKLTIGIL